MFSSNLNELKSLIYSQLANVEILRFMEISEQESLRSWEDEAIPFEGQLTFFEKYAQDLPSNTKYTWGIWSILVNPVNGLIFSLHFGRFTFIFRCVLPLDDLCHSASLQKAITLDDVIDISSLGENWAILNLFIEDEQSYLSMAYEQSERMYFN
jgi:hypothetical protein